MFRRPRRPKNSSNSRSSLKVTRVGDDNENVEPLGHDNVITDKEGRLRTLNTQPIGFDNRYICS